MTDWTTCRRENKSRSQLPDRRRARSCGDPLDRHLAYSATRVRGGLDATDVFGDERAVGVGEARELEADAGLPSLAGDVLEHHPAAGLDGARRLVEAERHLDAGAVLREPEIAPF